MNNENEFNKMDINTLENMVTEYRDVYRNAQYKMIEILIYLEAKGRFKENKRYATSSFRQYLEDRFYIKFPYYQDMKYAHIKFPEETKEYGIGLVSKVVNKCGRIKARKVLDKISTKRAALKNEMPRYKIDQIIDENALPKIEKTITDWHAMYEAERVAHDKTKLNLREALDTINELRAQVEKLKIALKKERGEDIDTNKQYETIAHA